MALIQKFEDIEAWQSGRVLAAEVFALCREGELARDFGLRGQMQRSAVSVMANIAEGFGRQGRKQLIQFLKIARGSCTELQSHQYLALDAELLSKEKFSNLQAQADKTGRKISGFIHYLTSAQGRNNSVRKLVLRTNNQQRITNNAQPLLAFRFSQVSPSSNS